jgi:hypothetical protein
MNNKLTLRMDESLIASAKSYAAAHGSSVSQMVANYFAALEQSTQEKSRPAQVAPGTDNADWEQKLGPITRSLVGLLKPQAGQKPLDEDDYHAYLEHKYLGSSHEGQSS